MVTPVELTMSRDFLVRSVTQNIAALHRHSELPGSAARRRASAAILSRQEAMLEWLVAQPEPFVCIAMFCPEASAVSRAKPRRRSPVAA